MTGAQEPEDMSTKTQRIAESARTHPQRAFTALAHHIDVAWLEVAWQRTPKDGAPGGPVRTDQVGELPGPAGATRLHRQRGWAAHPADRDTDAGG